MTEKFVIKGKKPLQGEVEIRGYKNAAGPALTATLLTKEECLIGNLPLVEDVFNIIEVLKSMKVKVERKGRKVKVKADSLDPETMDFNKVPKTRISVLLFGALLSRVRSFKIPPPGGDRIGLRPISVHLDSLRELGVKISREDNGVYQIESEKLKGKKIVLPEFSVTATETLMLAAVLAEDKTIIKGAAAEPQVQDLAEMLNKMGAKIKGAGTHTIEIEGVKQLRGVSHQIIPDPLEAGTFIVIGGATPGKVKVKNVNLEHLDLFLNKLREIGVNFKLNEDSIIVKGSSDLNSVEVQALPYPGFPTDLLPIIIPLLTKAEGKSLIHDPLYENRFNYTQELRKMGADIEIVDPHRAFIFGPTELKGVNIESWDIRAGACLVIAGLMAKGVTTIENIFQIDRGYEKIEERLQNLGGDIKRVEV